MTYQAPKLNEQGTIDIDYYTNAYSGERDRSFRGS